MKKEVYDDLFNIRIRLFRLFQIKEKLSAKETEDIFLKYALFDYIETCYEEYHVQGDEANLNDIYKYLEVKGWHK